MKIKLIKGDFFSPFFLFVIFLFSTNYGFGQNQKNFSYRYDFTGKNLKVAYSESHGVLFKANKNISFKKSENWYKYKTNKNYFFSEHYGSKNKFVSIDFYIVDKSFIKDDFYLKNNIKSFKATFGGIKYDNNYTVKYFPKNKKHAITENFYEADANQYIRLVITSSEEIDENFITDKKLFIGFSNFIKEFKESPKKVVDVLDVYFEKDYNAQIYLISKIDIGAYESNSLYGSVLVDLHTNEGSFNKVKDNISKRKKININSTTELFEIDNFLDDYSVRSDIVMLNEYHSYPHTRFNLMYAIKNLKNKNYNYLALEALHPKLVSDSIITSFTNLEGYYLEEPTCALLVAYASSLGFKFVAYEEDNQCSLLNGIAKRNCRDSIQAYNIKKIYDYKKDAKIVVIAGHAHIEKKTRNEWRFMRVIIDSLLHDKKIISLDQTKYIRSNLENKDIDCVEPMVFLSQDEQFDAYMISPFYSNYYDWYYFENEIMNKKIQLDLNIKDIYYIEIVTKENTNLSIFKSKVKNLLKDHIFLPKIIEYKIIYKDINNKIIKL